MPYWGGGGYLAPTVYDGSTNAWVMAVIRNGGTVSEARRYLINTLIVGLKNDGIWTKLDRLWLFAAENQGSALTDIVADSLATAVNSPVFDIDQGYTGADAGTIYINSGFNASTFSGVFVQDSSHISVWSNTDATSGPNGGVLIGISDNISIGSEILPKYNDGSAFFGMNGTADVAVANAVATGHYISSRTSSVALAGYRNGSSIASSGANTSVAMLNAEFAILAERIAGAGTNYASALQCSAASIGSGLSSGEATSFYNRLREYMTGVGVP